MRARSNSPDTDDERKKRWTEDRPEGEETEEEKGVAAMNAREDGAISDDSTSSKKRKTGREEEEEEEEEGRLKKDSRDNSKERKNSNNNNSNNNNNNSNSNKPSSGDGGRSKRKEDDEADNWNREEGEDRPRSLSNPRRSPSSNNNRRSPSNNNRRSPSNNNRRSPSRRSDKRSKSADTGRKKSPRKVAPFVFFASRAERRKVEQQFQREHKHPPSKTELYESAKHRLEDYMERELGRAPSSAELQARFDEEVQRETQESAQREANRRETARDLQYTRPCKYWKGYEGSCPHRHCTFVHENPSSRQTRQPDVIYNNDDKGRDRKSGRSEQGGRTICKFFKPGVPNSCRQRSCTFMHIEPERTNDYGRPIKRFGFGHGSDSSTRRLEEDRGTKRKRSPRRNEREGRSEGSWVSGVISYWNPQKGFGFMECDDGGPDLFVHCRALKLGSRAIKAVLPGTKVRGLYQRHQGKDTAKELEAQHGELREFLNQADFDDAFDRSGYARSNTKGSRREDGQVKGNNNNNNTRSPSRSPHRRSSRSRSPPHRRLPSRSPLPPPRRSRSPPQRRPSSRSPPPRRASSRSPFTRRSRSGSPRRNNNNNNQNNQNNYNQNNNNNNNNNNILSLDRQSSSASSAQFSRSPSPARTRQRKNSPLRSRSRSFSPMGKANNNNNNNRDTRSASPPKQLNNAIVINPPSPRNRGKELGGGGGRLNESATPSGADVLRIKLRWSDSVFRLSLPGPVTWDRMLDVLKTTPGVTSPFIVMYEDEDKDMVQLFTTENIFEAMHLQKVALGSSSTLNLFAKPK